MIAIVQASYMQVMAKKNQYMFVYKSDLNQEVQIFKNIFVKSNQDIDALILLSKSETTRVINEEANELKGLLTSMRQAVEQVMEQQTAMLLLGQQQIAVASQVNEMLAVSIEEAKVQHNKVLKTEMKMAQEKIEGLSEKVRDIKAMMENLAFDPNEKQSESGSQSAYSSSIAPSLS